LQLFLEYCFKTLNFNKVFLRTHISNIEAKALAEKCGFILEGKIRSDYKTSSGEIVDLLYYGKLKDK
jgi:RimJ/RimL family protein N-acetyltransferase